MCLRVCLRVCVLCARAVCVRGCVTACGGRPHRVRHGLEGGSPDHLSLPASDGPLQPGHRLLLAHPERPALPCAVRRGERRSPPQVGAQSHSRRHPQPPQRHSSPRSSGITAAWSQAPQPSRSGEPLRRAAHALLRWSQGGRTFMLDLQKTLTRIDLPLMEPLLIVSSIMAAAGGGGRAPAGPLTSLPLPGRCGQVSPLRLVRRRPATHGSARVEKVASKKSTVTTSHPGFRGLIFGRQLHY